MDLGEILPIISEMAVYLVIILCAPILYFWMKPFVRKKKCVLIAAVSYAGVMVLLNLQDPLSREALLHFPKAAEMFLKWLPILTAFCIICVGDPRSYRQKILLLLFIFLRWLVFGVFSELTALSNDFLYRYLQISWGIGAYLAEFLAWETFWVVGTISMLFFALRSIQKVYAFKQEDVTWQEFWMLLSPIAAMFLVRPLTMQYYELWNQGILNGTIFRNVPANPFRLAYYFCAYAASLSLLCFYQKIKRQQEERMQGHLLEIQMEENRRSMREMQGLYHDMSALKHDMGNHIAVIEQAICQGQAQEAAAYAKSLRDQWENAKPRIVTGNPITDIVLSETEKECRERGIAFESSFSLPEDLGADVFDLSVVLTNALGNALENTVKAPGDARIGISSFLRGGVFIISVKNTAAQRIELEAGELPVSTKQGAGHGYGLKNIRNVARKYGGEIDIRQVPEADRQWFILDIMLRCGHSQQK